MVGLTVGKRDGDLDGLGLLGLFVGVFVDDFVGNEERWIDGIVEGCWVGYWERLELGFIVAVVVE